MSIEADEPVTTSREGAHSVLGRVVALEYRPISPGGSIAGHLPLEPPVHALQETGAL